MIQNAKIAGNVLRLGVHSEWMAREVREYIEALERSNCKCDEAYRAGAQDERSAISRKLFDKRGFFVDEI